MYLWYEKSIMVAWADNLLWLLWMCEWLDEELFFLDFPRGLFTINFLHTIEILHFLNNCYVTKFILEILPVLNQSLSYINSVVSHIGIYMWPRLLPTCYCLLCATEKQEQQKLNCKIHFGSAKKKVEQFGSIYRFFCGKPSKTRN